MKTKDTVSVVHLPIGIPLAYGAPCEAAFSRNTIPKALVTALLSILLAGCELRGKPAKSAVPPAAPKPAVNPAPAPPPPPPLSIPQTRVELPKPQPVDPGALETETAPPEPPPAAAAPARSRRAPPAASQPATPPPPAAPRAPAAAGPPPPGSHPPRHTVAASRHHANRAARNRAGNCLAR